MRAGLVRLKTNTVVQYSVLHAVYEEDGGSSNFCKKISGPQSSND